MLKSISSSCKSLSKITTLFITKTFCTPAIFSIFLLSQQIHWIFEVNFQCSLVFLSSSKKIWHSQTVCVCVGVGHALESSESEDLAVVEKRCSSAKDKPKHVYFLFYWQSIIASRARPRVVARSNFQCVICSPSHARGVDFFSPEVETVYLQPV